MSKNENGVREILEEINTFMVEHKEMIDHEFSEELYRKMIYVTVLLNRSELLSLKKACEENPPLLLLYRKHKNVWRATALGVFILANLWFVSGLRRIILLWLNAAFGLPLELVELLAPVGAP